MNKKVLAFGIAVVLAILLFALLFSRVSEKPGPQTKPLGNIPYQSVNADAPVKIIIDSSQKLDNGNLVVKFHHSSGKDEPVSIIGAVRYQLSKATAKPNEEITLTVFEWSTEYFEIEIGKARIGFGRESESLDADTPVLGMLEMQGINRADVILEKDYGRRLTKAEKDAKKARGDNSPDASPFSKIYRDTKSGKMILVSQGLPMVDDVGMPIEVGWQEQGQSGRFTEKNNLFKATVNGNNVELTVKNDQPDGRKQNDQLTFQPQLFLNDVEQMSGDPVLLEIDPVNPNYQNNVLEWDFGIAKRRLRLIEGKVLGSWVFSANPNGDIRIVYDQVGDYRLKLGQYAIDNDTELVPASVFASATYPFTVSDSATYNPDANPETTSVDGQVVRATAGTSWADIRDGAGTTGWDQGTGGEIVYIYANSVPNAFTLLYRSIVLFGTSALPDSSTVSAATLSLYGYAKYDGNNQAPTINIYTSTPNSNTALISSDYGQIGAVAQSTAITYAGWSTAGYNDFALNDMTKIALTDVSKFGVREATYDAANSAPLSANGFYFQAYFSEQGTGYKPKLVVTYNLFANGEVCTTDGDCLSNKCRLGPNNATKYCTDATKTCGQSGGLGYDAGEEISNDECQTDGTWLCNGGYYNPSGFCIAAGSGYYSAEDSDTRTQCLAGYYGSTTTNSVSTCNGQCTAGYYCPAGSTSATQNECGLGNYCPAGSGSATACAAGTYGSSTTLATSSCSGQCSAGYYGSSTGQTASTCNGLCSASYYCPAGSTSSTQNACPAGTTSNPGSASADDCYPPELLQWTSYSSGPCNLERRIYCFEK